MDERQTIDVVDAVRLVLADGAFHSYQDLYRETAMQLRSRPRWEDVAQAAHVVGVDPGYVISRDR
jgi:hypothetical protein